MAEFYVSLSNIEIASQIALLINKYNLWNTIYTTDTIYKSPATYFVELANSQVVGCASTLIILPTLSKIQHICVMPEFRHKGIATKLVKLAINTINTEYLYMTIREDNIPSLALANTLHFSYVRKCWFKDHYTLTVGRKTLL